MQKVAIPTDDGRGLAHFGLARTMLVVSVADGQVVAREERPNPDPEHLSPAHHKLMMELVKDCQVVIAARMGPPMVQSLAHVGTRVLRAPAEDVEAALQAFLAAERGGPALAGLSLAEAETMRCGHDHHRAHRH